MEDYEKLYKDVLAKAREIHRNENEKKFDMEWLFPELADSNDERIRKALLEMVHDTTGDELWVDYNVHKEEALAWLEKQGQTFTKKDVDDAYLKGVCDAKQELEKQCEQKPFDYESANIQQKDFAPKQEPKKIEDEIEIPFGAKDSELREETYYIPKGFHAEIDNDKVVIKKGEKSAAWSDEDEENLQHCCMAISVDSLHTYEDKQDMEVWLKRLKERIGG